MGYEAYIQKALNVIDNGDVEWEIALAIVFEYLANKLVERAKNKRYIENQLRDANNNED